MLLSKHFTLAEFTASDTARRKGIKNQPDSLQINNMIGLAENILEPVRTYFGKPVRILSGFRCPELNTAIGGATNSQHMTGQAADITIDGVPNAAVWGYIFTQMDFDQVIAEKLKRDFGQAGWVHVSRVSPEKNRKQALSFTGTAYLKGLHYV